MSYHKHNCEVLRLAREHFCNVCLARLLLFLLLQILKPAEKKQKTLYGGGY